MSRKKSYPKRRPPRRKGIGGTLFLWVIMLAVVAGAVGQFVGPYAGWFEPAVERVRYIIMGDADPDPVAAVEDDDDDDDDTPSTGSGTTTVAKKDPLPPPTPIKDDPVVAKKDPVTQPNTGTGGTTTKKPPVTTDPKTDPKKPEEPEKLDYKALFDKYMKEELAKLRKPKPGRVWTVPTTKYDIMIGKAPTYKGVLMVIGNDRVVLRRNDNGQSVTITPDMLSESMQAKLFPRIVARRRAVERLDQIMAKNTPKTPPKKDPHTGSDTGTNGGSTTVVKKDPLDPPDTGGNGSSTPRPQDHGFLKKYDPTREKTPRHLGGPVKEYGQWIEMQQRRVGGQFANALYAKQHGSQVVLYMQVNSNFTRQSHDTREVWTEMFWSMWSRKCRENGRVSSLQRAHLVIVDKDQKIIGGSKVKRASDIWVKR